MLPTRPFRVVGGLYHQAVIGSGGTVKVILSINPNHGLCRMVCVLSLLIHSATLSAIFPKLMAGAVLVYAMSAKRWIQHLDL